LTQALPRAFDEFRAADMADLLAAMIAADLPDHYPGTSRAAEIVPLMRQWRGLTGEAPLVPAPELAADDTPEPPQTRQGEALLAAMEDIDAGLEGDLPRAGRGIAMLRALGLTEDARRAEAQITLLPQMIREP
ncbi:MAG: hypothetical protein ACK4YU_02890, partial [Paracoccus sp. (in: a-proteobacteria)]